MATQPNALYFGDNLDVLRAHIRDESVDLVNLDPPFNSKRDCNLLSKSLEGRKRPEFPDLALGTLTFKKAKKENMSTTAETPTLFGDDD